jgi:lysozyme family protein
LLHGLPPIANKDAIIAYADARLSFLHGLKNWKVFGAGWGRRVGGVEAESLRMSMSSTGVIGEQQDATLREHSTNISSKAAKHLTKAAGALPVGAGAAVASQQAQLPEWMFFVIFALGVAGFAFFIFKHIQHTQRAASIKAIATGAKA